MGNDILIGFRGQAPHDVFQEYMESVVNDPVFAGMPDAHYDDGRIQWEAPSNRTSGKFKDSHQKRRDWWAEKANSLGIDTAGENWISRVAKQIHPTKEKPCKKCGQIMEIRYVYLGAHLLNRVEKLSFVSREFELSQIEDIYSLLARLSDEYGDQAVASFPEILKTKEGPDSLALEDWLEWINTHFVLSEPSALSPGAMSNAPDRFEGFYSFNRCCRATADSGRTKKNLRSYTTDRRVFEYWTSGDWIAADRLMGLIRKDFRDEKCLNGHEGPCQADHIGPISLGFNHRPNFQLLCGPCNSGKNNRMSLSDMHWLLKHEASGETVISWHSSESWNRCKTLVTTDEEASRLSKILRDNRHSYMAALSKIADKGHVWFLASLLELGHADFNVDFEELRIEKHLTIWDKINHTKRETKYASEQKARRARIAFEELSVYFQKRNRNSFIAQNAKSDDAFSRCLSELGKQSNEAKSLDEAMVDALGSSESERDGAFRNVFEKLGNPDPVRFAQARLQLEEHMNSVGEVLSSMWEDDRYSRVALKSRSAQLAPRLFE